MNSFVLRQVQDQGKGETWPLNTSHSALFILLFYFIFNRSTCEDIKKIKLWGLSIHVYQTVLITTSKRAICGLIGPKIEYLSLTNMNCVIEKIIFKVITLATIPRELKKSYFNLLLFLIAPSPRLKAEIPELNEKDYLL